jgi:hypothetical protein
MGLQIFYTILALIALVIVLRSAGAANSVLTTLGSQSTNLITTLQGGQGSGTSSTVYG